MKRSVRRLVVLAGILAWGCGGSNPAAPVVTPTPTPTPTPKPEATPTPVAKKTCTEPPSNPTVNNCAYNKKTPNGVFYSQVVGSIDILRQQKPDFFDGKAIRQVNKFYDGVIRVLEEEYGLCAVRGGEGFPGDEIGIKQYNDFSEQWDIVAYGKDGRPYPIWDYTVTCKPARF